MFSGGTEHRLQAQTVIRVKPKYPLLFSPLNKSSDTASLPHNLPENWAWSPGLVDEDLEVMITHRLSRQLREEGEIVPRTGSHPY